MNAVTLMQTNTGWYATNSGPWAACEGKSGEKFAHWTTPDATAIEGAGPEERKLFNA